MQSDENFWRYLGWGKDGVGRYTRLIQTNAHHVYSLVYEQGTGHWDLFDSREPMKPCHSAFASNLAAAHDAALQYISEKGFLLQREPVRVATAPVERSLLERAVEALESMVTLSTKLAESPVMQAQPSGTIDYEAAYVALKKDYDELRASYQEQQIRMSHMASQLEATEATWFECHDGSEQACCKSHE